MALFRLTFLVVAGFYLAVALPALLWLPQHPSQPISWQKTRTLIRQAYLQVFNTLQHWRQQANTFRFLAGYYLISDVIVTLNTFIEIYFSKVFGLSISQILQISLLFNVTSVISTLGFGSASDRISHQRLLQFLFGFWSILILVMALSTHPQTPLPGYSADGTGVWAYPVLLS
ncbi:MFS transporter [Leptodesmis sp.]|uniref:MFS transporter n=1 Tax=Leptodesmis sp. TaxID=3100501 RepID=UPI00405353F9